MKAIQVILVLLLSLSVAGNADAQLFKKLKKAVRKSVEEGITKTVEEKVYQKTSEKTGKALDSIMGKAPKEQNPKGDPVYGTEKETNSTGSLEEEASSLEEVSSGSSFKRGSSILYDDDFSRDAVGDFPAKWNTNAGGELKKLTGFEGKWLKIPANSIVNLEMTKPLPSNFTIEFDMVVPSDAPIRMSAFGFGKKPQKFDHILKPKEAYAFWLLSNEYRTDLLFGGSRTNSDLEYTKRDYKVPLNKKIHIGIMVNNHQRIRMFIDGAKMVDAPRGFMPEYAKAFFFNAMTHGAKASLQNYFYVSNVLIAETGTDKRSLVAKDLIEKGTFTTNDILFESGSDKIASSSATILNQIGNAMQSVPEAQFLIIGHTDSDGSDSANQTLSQKRANSVKNYLVSHFTITANRLTCAGKGESEPVADNATDVGKAQNRRVEFRKL